MSYKKSYTKNKPLFEDTIAMLGLAGALEMIADMGIPVKQPKVKQVIFNPPATIVNWSDGTKTVARCAPEDKFNEEFGFAMACAKRLVKPYETFQDYLKNAVRVKAKPVRKTKQTKKATANHDGKMNFCRKQNEKSYNAVRDLFKLLSDDSIGEIEIKFG